MTRLLYDIEDYLEDASHTDRVPGWMRRVMRSIGRTVGNGRPDRLAPRRVLVRQTPRQ